MVDKVLQRWEVSPHNSRLSPHSEDAHSLRDEASLEHYVREFETPSGASSQIECIILTFVQHINNSARLR